jgi:hypothetical protein
VVPLVFPKFPWLLATLLRVLATSIPAVVQATDDFVGALKDRRGRIALLAGIWGRSLARRELGVGVGWGLGWGFGLGLVRTVRLRSRTGNVHDRKLLETRRERVLVEGMARE